MAGFQFEDNLQAGGRSIAFQFFSRRADDYPQRQMTPYKPIFKKIEIVIKVA